MTKKYFVQEISHGHHGGDSELKKDYNNGIGKVIRKAVDYEDLFEEMDSLPKKVRGNKGRVWDQGYSSHYRWQLQNRWLKAQVGRHIDEVYSEICALSKGRNPAARRLRKLFHSPWEGLHVRGRLEIINGIYGPRLALVNAEGNHIYDPYVDHNSVYVNLDGILSLPDKVELDHAQSLRKKFQEDYRKECLKNSERVLEIQGHYYFRLKGDWMELSLARTSKLPGASYNPDYLRPPCLLCKALGGPWTPIRALDLFPKIDHFCTSMRRLSKKEAKFLIF